MAKHYRIRWGLLLMGGLLGGCAGTKTAHYTPGQTYSTEVLRKDFRLLRDILEADHPSLYWYTPADSIRYYFAEADSSIQAPMTESAFRNLVASTLAHVRCGHTGVRPSKKFENYTLSHPQPQFPFQIKVLPEIGPVRQTADPDPVPKPAKPALALVFNPYLRDTVFRTGDILTSINGVPAQALIDSLKGFLSVDGYSYNFAYQRLSGDFPLWYDNVFGKDSVYRIGIHRPGRIDFSAKVKAYDFQTDTTLAEALRIWEMGAPYRRSKKEELERVRYLRIDTSGRLAVMNLRSFADGVKKDFIRKSFKLLKKEKVPNLVIDLRTNTGGVISTAVCLARYLKPADFVFVDSVTSTTRHLSYKKYLDRHFIYQLGMTFLTRKKEDGLYHFRYFEGTRYHPYRKHHYTGHVYILTGGFTFSAASIFTANMKGTPDVTIVGEETGGGYYGNNGVFITEATLPGTGLRISLPLFRMVINHRFPKDGRGVMPDIEVVPTISDIRGAVDPKMKKVLELIGMPGVAQGAH